MMKNLSGLPLDDDILDRVLMFSPTFEDLYATILSSKSFHAVYNAYPHSIIRNVAYNVAGPALPQAVRLVRYELAHSDDSDHDDDGSDTESESSDAAPRVPGEETTDISPLTTPEIYALRKVAAVAKGLEDLFSMRHKNRTSKTSVLSSSESWRFRRAVYRIMLYSRRFPGYVFLDPDSDWALDQDEEDDDAHQSRLSKERKARKIFLEDYVTQELLEIHSVVEFLGDTAEWITRIDRGSNPTASFRQTFLSAGPSEIFDAYQHRSLDPIQDCLRGGLFEDSEMLVEYISHPLSKLWEDRKTKPPPVDGTHWRYILDDVKGENDTCAQCGKTDGLELWGQANWDYLNGISGVFSLHELPTLLKGELKRNQFVTPYLTAQHSPSPMIQRIFEIKTPTFDAWTKEDWLCTDCIANFLSSHLHLWILDRKRTAGETIPEDCWYGYNCRTQTHRPLHAQKLNHLCEPSR